MGQGPTIVCPFTGRGRGCVATREATPEFVRAHDTAIQAWKKARGHHGDFAAVQCTPEYGQLLGSIRSAAVSYAAGDPTGESARKLAAFADALDVPVMDLERLARVPAHLAAKGRWRPRSINVDLAHADGFARLTPEATGFQRWLNTVSHHFPPIREQALPDLLPLYWTASAALPLVDSLGRLAATPLEAAAGVARSWSDDLADDLQRTLRKLRIALRPTLLTPSDLASLPPSEQRLFVSAARAISHLAIDTDAFIRWARDPDSARPLPCRVRRLASSTLHGLDVFLDGLAKLICAFTKADAWRAFTMHLQFGGAVTQPDTKTASRAGVVFILPTIEQVRRSRIPIVKVVCRADPIESMIGGIHLNSRGGGVRFSAGPISAKLSEYEHELKVGIPGQGWHFALGEDYVYGPMAALSYNVHLGAASRHGPCLRFDPEVKVYHPAIRRIVRPTRLGAEFVSVLCDDVWRALGRAVGRVRRDAKRGWPEGQRFIFARQAMDRAEFAASQLLARLEDFQKIPVSEFANALGPAGLDCTAEEAPERYVDIIDCLSHLILALRDETKGIRRRAEQALSGKGAQDRELSRAVQRLRRVCREAEFINLFLGEILEAVVKRNT